MKEKEVEELGHNYPVDPKRSPYSRFEERYFPIILVSVTIISLVILFLFLYFKYNFYVALIIICILIVIPLPYILGNIVKSMIRRRERLLDLKE